MNPADRAGWAGFPRGSPLLRVNLGALSLCAAVTFSSWGAARAQKPSGDFTCGGCHAAEGSDFDASVHAQADVSCITCHGGAERYELPADAAQLYTSDRRGEDRPAFDHGEMFRGTPDRAAGVTQCGECHADVELMNPHGLRTDVLARYRSGPHGKALFENHDAKAAACVDCHGVHLVRGAADEAGPTHPRRVPDTCGRCHADAELMGAYGIPHEIVEEFKHSVHGVALLEKRDPSAPACAFCHDAHASLPPGHASVQSVCGRCHPQEQTFFEQSPHAGMAVFPGCIACHGGEHGHGITDVFTPPEDLVVMAGADAGPPDMKRIHPRLSLMGDACAQCHDDHNDDAADVEALARARALYDRLAASESRYVAVAARVEAARRGVIPAREETSTLNEARTLVVGMAPLQHSLSVEEVGKRGAELDEILARIDHSLDAKTASVRRRHYYLIPLWTVVLALSAALYARHRRLAYEWRASARTIAQGPR